MAMRIGGIDTALLGASAKRPAARRHEPREAASDETRAVIAVAPPAPTERTFTSTRYPAAPFLAHLIATQMHAPQTRERRRAEPETAVAAYGAEAIAPVRGRFTRFA